MSRGANRFRGFNQRGGAGKVGNRREFHRRKMQACPIQTYGCGRYQNVADVNVRLNSPRGADTQEGTNTQLRQFFHGNRGRRAADTGRANDNCFTIQLSAPGGEFAVRCQLNRLIHQRGDLFHTLRIARDDGELGPL
ncbi:Uncharacterised protein [Salmonella enterica subsp. enterica serovar Bovismorbificans]|uniref:Uncharacterized protein n=1 Tax=Salmonella enterica subsp. enterica serovar Bovismorbificans TaxID=58097 RepID=A0A655CZ13_SALET|nr:Uncharacterised protein [Salmonella enterica subsp. enterica serovar Bovismorbificans]